MLRLETEMARVRPTREQRRDPASQHYPMTVAELHALAPGWPWPSFLAAIGAPAAQDFNVPWPQSLAAATALWLRSPRVEQQAYLRWQLLHALAASLPARLREEDFRFYGTVLRGVPQMPPLWKGCARLTNDHLGEAVGRVFVEGQFPPEAKRRALEDVRSIQAALRDDIAGIPWMGESTREEALRKLDAFRVKVGYPDRKFDHLGNLRDWWTPVDAARFEERAQCLVDEYSGFLVADDKRLNGRLTLGENLADNGGIRLAYAALERRLGSGARPRVDGFDPEQRFFLSFAKTQCGAVSDETARNRLLTDPHSPGRWRVNGTLRNMPEFRAAFACKAGDSMVSPNPCRVW